MTKTDSSFSQGKPSQLLQQNATSSDRNRPSTASRKRPSTLELPRPQRSTTSSLRAELSQETVQHTTPQSQVKKVSQVASIADDDSDNEPFLHFKRRRLLLDDAKGLRGKAIERSTDKKHSPRDKQNAVNADNLESAANSSQNWQWTDEEQVVFRPVVRIHVHDDDAAERVTEARLNGVPVCLVGHCGWPQFSRRWLKPMHEKRTKQRKNRNDEWIDLAQPHKVDVAAMIKDIGYQRVPLLRTDYDEQNPCKEQTSVASFLTKYWKDDVERQTTSGRSQRSPSSPSGYMHQWQFPLSASSKLCNECQPLPNDIFGEDLLRYWLDYADCKGDSPFQYLFMGDVGTMSKLHKDNGGLTISIAPIVGKKECVMVHRSDGASCMYHLAANLDDIDLHQYPLMSYARIWKTVLHPGEILIMPQGTYHQCRNVTPCLSYSRFHLDTVNLRPFLESWVNRDAKEIDHGEVIWNASCELRERLDQYVKKVQRCSKPYSAVLSARPLPEDIVETVNTLRSLRHVCRAIAQRLEHLKSHDMHGGDERQWNDLVNDIDFTLHELRYRFSKRSTVPFFPREASYPHQDFKNLKSIAAHAVEQPFLVASNLSRTKPSRSSRCSRPVQQLAIPSNQESFRTAGFVPRMDEVLSRLKKLSPDDRDRTLSDSVQLVKGVCIQLRYHDKSVKGKILNVVDDMQAAYVSFEGYSSCYDEYQAFECLRTPMTGDFSLEVRKDDVKEGSVVLNRWGEHGEEYRAVVLHTRCGTFYLVELVLGRQQIQRWVTREMVIRRH